MFTYTIFLVNIFNSLNLLIINYLYFHKWLILTAPQWVIYPPPIGGGINNSIFAGGAEKTKK